MSWYLLGVGVDAVDIPRSDADVCKLVGTVVGSGVVRIVTPKVT
jgi:hypothetical protein